VNYARLKRKAFAAPITAAIGTPADVTIARLEEIFKGRKSMNRPNKSRI